MAFERKLPAVPARPFTVNGGSQGQVSLLNTRGFKVGMKAVITGNALPTLLVLVKRVLSDTKLLVGPIGSPYEKAEWINLSSYTVAANAQIYAESQEKAKVPPADIIQAVYDQEPTVAQRSVLVDQLGRYYDFENPIPIIFGGTVQIGNVTIQDDDGDELSINSDGSLNVNVVTSAANNVRHEYGEASAVLNGIETTIVQYVVPLLSTNAILQRVSVSGENIARYQVLINDVVIDTRRTCFGANLSEYFEFSTDVSDGYTLSPGDVVKVNVFHNRSNLSDFEGRIQVLQIT